MKNTGQAITFAMCLLVLETIAIINSFVINLKGATVDAERFIEHATIWTKVGKLEFATNSEFFIQFLGIIFLVTGPSEFIATQFGLLAFAVAAVFFVKLCEELKIEAPNWAIALFLLWPSGLTRLTTTMREPYLILFTVLICFYVVAYKNHQRTPDLIKLFATCIVAFLFHKAYAVFFVFAMGYILFFVLKREGSWFKSRVVFMRIALIGGTLLTLTYIMLFQSEVRGLKPLVAMLTADTDYIGQIVDYKSSREFRTTYDVTLDVSSPVAFVTSVPLVFIYYMFSPFPWQISSPVDLLAALESLFRLGAIALVANMLFIRRNLPEGMIPVTVLVLVLCMVWAAGTTNYGTASRHHLTTNWAFLLVYVVFLSRRVRAISGSRPRRTTMAYQTS